MAGLGDRLVAEVSGSVGAQGRTFEGCGGVTVLQGPISLVEMKVQGVTRRCTLGDLEV